MACCYTFWPLNYCQNAWKSRGHSCPSSFRGTAKASVVHAFCGSGLAANYWPPDPIGCRLPIESPPLPLSISCAPVESGSSLVVPPVVGRRVSHTVAAVAARRSRTDDNRALRAFLLLCFSRPGITPSKVAGRRRGRREGESRKRLPPASPWVRVSPETRRLLAGSKQGNDLNTLPEMVCCPWSTLGDSTTTTAAATAVDSNFFPE